MNYILPKRIKKIEKKWKELSKRLREIGFIRGTVSLSTEIRWDYYIVIEMLLLNWKTIEFFEKWFQRKIITPFFCVKKAASTRLAFECWDTLLYFLLSIYFFSVNLSTWLNLFFVFFVWIVSRVSWEWVWWLHFTFFGYYKIVRTTQLHAYTLWVGPVQK